jgi:hypothetical protein
MSYETKYHQEICRNLHPPRKKQGKQMIIICMCLLGALLLGICLRNKRFWKELFVPGDYAVTVGAIDNLTTELKDGTNIATAFENFCLEIMADD